MKGISTLIPLAITSLAVPVVSQAAEETVMSSAVWQAEANKNTTSHLVITPMRTLQFKYSPSNKAFNFDTGTFDIAVSGDHSNTGEFKLEARVDDSNNVLHQVGGNSTLQIGAAFASSELGSSQGGTATGVGASKEWTPLIDSSKDLGTGSALWSLTRSTSVSTLVSASDNFKFMVKKATLDGKAAVTDMSTLPDAMWQGEVAVAFRATWSKPTSTPTPTPTPEPAT